MEASQKLKNSFIFVPELNLEFSEDYWILINNWRKAHIALESDGMRMATLQEYRVFLRHLRDSENPHYNSLYNDIISPQSQIYEWLDTKFLSKMGSPLSISNRNEEGEELGEYLKTDWKGKMISLDLWLDDANPQGLPHPDIGPGNLYYRSPERAGMGPKEQFNVPRFGHDGDRLELICISPIKVNQGWRVGARAVREAA